MECLEIVDFFLMLFKYYVLFLFMLNCLWQNKTLKAKIVLYCISLQVRFESFFLFFFTILQQKRRSSDSGRTHFQNPSSFACLFLPLKGSDWSDHILAHLR